MVVAAGGRMDGYLRWWALGMVVLLGVVIAAALAGGGDEGSTDVTGRATTSAAAPDSAVWRVGVPGQDLGLLADELGGCLVARS